MAQDSYENIKGYARAFRGAVENMGKGVAQAEARRETLAVMMEREQIEQLLAITGVTKVAAVIGVDKGRLTVALLGADDQDQILSSHIDGTEKGQQVWPTVIPVDDLENFLP